MHSPVRSATIGPVTTRGSGVNSVPVPVQTRVVIGITLRAEQVAEHSPQVGNIRFGLKFKTAAVGQVFSKLARTSLT